MTLKILATSDLHLGRKSSGVPENAEQSSSKHTWKRIVKLCIDENVDALLLVGDIVDQDNRYFEAIGPLQAGFEELKKADIAVYMVAGNHDFDVLAQIAGNEKYDNIHLLGAGGTWELKMFSKDNNHIQLVGWSFPKSHTKEDPLFSFNNINIDPNYPAIGALHCDIYNQNSSYAPVNPDNLANKNVNAWILGHIHKPDMLKEDNPCIFYPGSPHAFSVKEPGIHGAVLMEIDNNGRIKTKTIPLSPVRYESISVNVANTDDEISLRDKTTMALSNNANEMIDKLGNVEFLVYDVHLEGIHSKIKELDKWTLSLTDYEQKLNTGTKIWVRKVENFVKPAIENLEELAKQPSPEGLLADTILALQNGTDTQFLSELKKEWEDKYKKLSNAGTYKPLHNVKNFNKVPEKDAEEYIMKECNRLLAELRMQQQGD